MVLVNFGSEGREKGCGFQELRHIVALRHRDTWWIIELIVHWNGETIMVSEWLSTGFMIANLPDDYKTLRHFLVSDFKFVSSNPMPQVHGLLGLWWMPHVAITRCHNLPKRVLKLFSGIGEFRVRGEGKGMWHQKSRHIVALRHGDTWLIIE